MEDNAGFAELSVEDFGTLLENKGFDLEVIKSFKSNKISGGRFMKLTEAQIEKLVTAMGDVVELKELQGQLGPPNPSYRTSRGSVHTSSPVSTM